MIPRLFRVSSVREDTHDTATLVLEPDDGLGLAFRPGQYTMLYVFGVGEVPISISGDPGRPETLIHTIREVGAVTRALVGLREGDLVGVRGPFGTTWPVDKAEGMDLLLVAGGIGLAPLRPVMELALSHRSRFGRVSLVYGARSPSDLLYSDQLGEWNGRVDLDVEVTVDVSTPDWLGDVGTVTGVLPRIPVDPDRTVAMLCGPEVMMKVVAGELGSAGLDAANIYVSIERNMKCAIGLCGHCQFGSDFVCWGGPVFSYDLIASRLLLREL
jgi:NAD(P)H-flavin reductase